MDVTPGVCTSLDIPEGGALPVKTVQLSGQDAPMTCFLFARINSQCVDAGEHVDIILNDLPKTLEDKWRLEIRYFRCEKV